MRKLAASWRRSPDSRSEFVLLPFDTTANPHDSLSFSRGPLIARLTPSAATETTNAGSTVEKIISDREGIVAELVRQLETLDSFSNKFLGIQLSLPPEIIPRRMENDPLKSRNQLLAGALADSASPINEIAINLLNAKDRATQPWEMSAVRHSPDEMVDEINAYCLAAACLRFNCAPAHMKGSDPIESQIGAIGGEELQAQWWAKHPRTLDAGCEALWKRFVRQVDPGDKDPPSTPDGILRAAALHRKLDSYKDHKNQIRNLRTGLDGKAPPRFDEYPLVAELVVGLSENRSRVSLFRSRNIQDLEREAAKYFQKAFKQLTQATESGKSNDIYDAERELRMLTHVQLYIASGRRGPSIGPSVIRRRKPKR